MTAPKPDRRPSNNPDGRPPLPYDQQTRPRSVRLNDARWEKLKRLGTDWLARQIDRAPEPRE